MKKWQLFHVNIYVKLLKYYHVKKRRWKFLVWIEEFFIAFSVNIVTSLKAALSIVPNCYRNNPVKCEINRTIQT